MAEVRDRIAPIITELVDKAKEQGVVRPDFDQSDLIFMQLGLSAIMEQTRDVSPELYRRYLAMMLDAIRADSGAPSELPVAPLSVNETHQAMTRDGVVITTPPDSSAACGSTAAEVVPSNTSVIRRGVATTG